jgi:hypothetical protein
LHGCVMGGLGLLRFMFLRVEPGSFIYKVVTIIDIIWTFYDSHKSYIRTFASDK